LGMGDIYARSAWFYSDSSLKYLVKPIVSPLTTIKSLRGVTFRYKPEVPCDSCEGTVTLSNDSTLHYGLIAQEVEQVLPTLVTRNPEGLKLVSYMELVPILLEGMKAQQTQIDELRAEIELLKNK
jgi:trimeric autotransporter adhesin